MILTLGSSSFFINPGKRKEMSVPTNLRSGHTFFSKPSPFHNPTNPKFKQITPTIKINHREVQKNRKNHASLGTITDVLRLMDCLNVQVTPEIYTSLVKECTLSRDPASALSLHSHIARNSLKHIILPLLINRLLLMHVSCGHLETAHQLFEEMRVRDFNSWTALIAGYIDNGLHFDAISLFLSMTWQISMFDFPFPASAPFISCLLTACMNLGFGKQVHGCLLKLGYTNHMLLTASLIDMYETFGCLEGANFVFNQISQRNTMIWTDRILANWRGERFYEIVKDFRDMGGEGVRKNSFVFSIVLRACGWIRNEGRCGQQVHADAIKLGLESKMFTQWGLIYMYGKCGLLRDAERVFYVVNDKTNPACWNAMLMGYMQYGFYIEAIRLVGKMKSYGLEPHEYLLNELKSCYGSDIKNL